MDILSTYPLPVGAAWSDETAWQTEMKTAIRDARKLCQVLQLPVELAARAAAGGKQFPVFAPLPYVAKMRPGDERDPLLLQVLPLAAEADEVAGYTSDPVGDQSACMEPGLLQKYPGRALLITTGACAVHCRYCFRRHFPYHGLPKSVEQWRTALDRIARDRSLEEILLSGGDPLTLLDSQLNDLLSSLADISHVKRLRIHSRLPVVIPQRITAELAQLLQRCRMNVVFVIHANHPRELDDAVGQALDRLSRAGCLLLNQSVLLRGVNDHVDTLAELSGRLIQYRVLPYYLHQLDPVRGAAHFHVPVQRGKRIVQQLRLRLPGYAVPRYVQEVAGAGSKQCLA